MTRCVKYIARHEYKLEIDFCDKEESSYKVAAKKKEPPPEEEEQEKERVYEDFPDENGKQWDPDDSDSD